MDFLLECIGFPPDQDPDDLIALARARGERDPLRGTGGEHLRLPLTEGVELRCDRDEGEQSWTLLPFFRERQRLRLAVRGVRRMDDSPYDALLTGWVGPTPTELHPERNRPGAYLLACWLADAQRLPRPTLPGRVLSVCVAGFALETRFVGPNALAPDPSVFDREHGALLVPLAGEDAPGGCMDASLRVQRVRRARNPITGLPIVSLECDAPERSLRVFLSPWELEAQGAQEPRPGWRVEGTFMFQGRIAGGLPGPARRVRRHFG